VTNITEKDEEKERMGVLRDQFRALHDCLFISYRRLVNFSHLRGVLGSQTM